MCRTHVRVPTTDPCLSYTSPTGRKAGPVETGLPDLGKRKKSSGVNKLKKKIQPTSKKKTTLTPFICTGDRGQGRCCFSVGVGGGLRVTHSAHRPDTSVRVSLGYAKISSDLPHQRHGPGLGSWVMGRVGGGTRDVHLYDSLARGQARRGRGGVTFPSRPGETVTRSG